jgi:hypothetical protein
MNLYRWATTSGAATTAEDTLAADRSMLPGYAILNNTRVTRVGPLCQNNPKQTDSIVENTDMSNASNKGLEELQPLKQRIAMEDITRRCGQNNSHQL